MTVAKNLADVRYDQLHGHGKICDHSRRAGSLLHS